MELSIVIVNWNSRDLLLRCVASIHTALGAAGHGVAGYEVIVVDNASSDGSVERAGLTSGETVIRNCRNAGFAAACNQGAQAASGEVLLMLNPDCELRPGSAERCLRELRRTDMAVGICGVALLDASGTVAKSCERFFNFATLMGAATGLNALLPTRMGARMREWDHTEDRTVDHVIGAFYMVRADTWRALGGFDERFHVYYEDMDLSKRAPQRLVHALSGAARLIPSWGRRVLANQGCALVLLLAQPRAVCVQASSALASMDAPGGNARGRAHFPNPLCGPATLTSGAGANLARLHDACSRSAGNLAARAIGVTILNLISSIAVGHRFERRLAAAQPSSHIAHQL